VPQAGFLFNSPLHMRTVPATLVQEVRESMRIPPFAVFGAHNVFLETVKRGEYDATTGKSTIILRLYEAFGGHAQARLRINGSRFHVSGVSLTNVLEEAEEDIGLNVVPFNVDGDVEVKLDFRGFEFKTVKIDIDTEGKHRHV